MTPDYYALLGVPPKATPRDIQVAYRKGVLACHPDRDPSPEALARSQKLGEAYAVLRDPQKRHKYDLDQCYERGFPNPKETPHYRATGSVRVDINLEAKIREVMREYGAHSSDRQNGHLGSCTCKDCRPEWHQDRHHKAHDFMRSAVESERIREAAMRNGFSHTPGHHPECACPVCERARLVYAADGQMDQDDEGSGL